MNVMLKTAGLSVLASGLIACGGDENQDAAVPQNYHNITTHLQGTVFDAVTGARISNESLKVLLVQGDKYRTAKLNKEYAGDYFIQDIPTSTENNVTFRMEATATGYQPVIASVDFNADTNNLQDKNAWRMGNFYLYPLGVSAADMTVTVTYNGEKIEGAAVQLQPNTNGNTLTADSINVIAPNNGFQGAITATTDVEGNAVFSGDALVLGGRYQVQILPMSYKGIELGQPTAVNVNIGTSTIHQRVAMVDIVPGNNDGLYVAQASNEDDNAINSNGTLTLKLSRPVSIVNESFASAALTNATTAVLDTNSQGSEVTVTLSADGLTLTLQPNFITNPVNFNGNNSGTADNAMYITYSNLFVRLQDGDTTELYNVLNLVDTSGLTVSGRVNVTVAF
ncbi:MULTISPECIES: hypothetical protein [unclassified Thalassolituus]|uniref:hypothetical protein n=1 Tax=unclassified Thalassolituus TaxID=2624967 RepID=UPI001CE25B17|nr:MULTISPECIES: hypothetical protein [unclassified Thalassolituus]MCA6060392.1 hypothetical protein [Thalassolituus sp. ST750PaO-4]